VRDGVSSLLVIGRADCCGKLVLVGGSSLVEEVVRIEGICCRSHDWLIISVCGGVIICVCGDGGGRLFSVCGGCDSAVTVKDIGFGARVGAVGVVD